MRRISFILPFLLARLVFAEATDGKLTHESEASAVLASGNTDAQTFSVKQATAYAWDKNKGTFTGSYLLGKSAGSEIAKRWDLGLRYDREFSDVLGGFLGYQIDSNRFSGFDPRHTLDLGAKYFLIKSDETKLSAEGGYRYQSEKRIDGSSNSFQMGRAYAEWQNNWNKQVSSKLWTEFIYNFTNSTDYRFNIEPSLSVVLTDIFSLKVAYLLNFRNLPALSTLKKWDSLYTTSLVAKF